MKIAKLPVLMFALALAFVGFTDSGNAQGYHYEPLHQNTMHQGGMSYFFGDNLPDTTLSGIVSIDSTYMIPHYFLDTDSDTIIDYLLSFGPWWYSPENINRPIEGASITVSGKFHETLSGYSVVIVEYLDGSLWRDISNGMHFSGNWVHRNAADTTVIYCPVDSNSNISFPPGSMGTGGMWSNSFFVDMNQLPNQWMPGSDENMVVGFHFEFMTESGQDMMYGNWGQMGGYGMGRMTFQQNISHRFHYDQSMIDSVGINEEDLMLHYWDNITSTWMPFLSSFKSSNSLEASNIIHYKDDNIFELNTTQNYDYVAVFHSSVTGVENENNRTVVSEFNLMESYPNPFNPSVNIKFTIENVNKATISVYSVTGQLIKTLARKSFTQGYHIVTWDGTDAFGEAVAGGIYLVRLNTPGYTLSKKVTLLK